MPSMAPLNVTIFNSEPRLARTRNPTERAKAAQAEVDAAKQRKLDAQRKVTVAAANKENSAALPSTQPGPNPPVKPAAAKAPAPKHAAKPSAPRAIPIVPTVPVILPHARDEDLRDAGAGVNPPTSPTVARKRPAESDDPDKANLPLPKRAKRNSKSKSRARRPRPRAGDLPAREQRFVNRAYVAMRGLVSTNPYGTKDERESMIDLAIARARTSRPEDADVVVTDDMRLLISYRVAQMLGDIKRNVSDRFEGYYGLQSSDKKKVIAKNEAIAARLLLRNGFVYKDPAARTGMFKNPSISASCNATWFGSRDKEGPMFGNLFNPDSDGIPISALAILLAAHHNCALEWKTGVKKAITFSEGHFADTYESIKAMLERFSKHNAVSKTRLVNLRRDLYLAGMSHAGVIVPAAEVEVLDEDDFARAAADFDSDDEGNDDDERYQMPHDFDDNLGSPMVTPLGSPMLAPQSFDDDELSAEERMELDLDPDADLDDNEVEPVEEYQSNDDDDEQFDGSFDD